jgi:hypothetical protein
VSMTVHMSTYAPLTASNGDFQVSGLRPKHELLAPSGDGHEIKNK